MTTYIDFTTGDCNETFSNVINDVYTALKTTPETDMTFIEINDRLYNFHDIDSRMEWSNDLVELYMEQTGQIPPSRLLERLSTLILRKTGDPSEVFSESKMRRKDSREMSSSGFIDTSVGNDKRLHVSPTRRR